MARKVIAGNWKMNGDRSFAQDLVKSLLSRPEWGDLKAEVVVCPPALLVSSVAEQTAGTPIHVGGQDCHQNARGAHTGDQSPELLADLGASHVIVGHSERRQDHGETDNQIRSKAEAALRAGLTPIFCIGETEQERSDGQTLAVVEKQIRDGLPDLSAADSGADRLIVAYEPVWAIGTGKTATASDVAEVHAALRRLLIELLGEQGGQTVPLLYGGSVKPDNADELLSVDDVDGALIGGASLKADDFWAIALATL
ncbi:triose-phosphate isomerase [Kiloniella sp. b19]|uniref:triose-phosphate isomerase n=1 Tax=Kiloniella sp. GXU_MW_B19 TaxID=3141326 RepID=UPI0031D46B75